MPALNDLLSGWGIALGDTVVDGELSLGSHDAQYSSGTHLVRFPPDGHVITVKMRDQGREVLGETGELSVKVPVLGLYQTRASHHGGRLVVFGDSNCIDGAHLTKPCYWLMDAMLEYTSAGHLPQVQHSLIHCIVYHFLADYPRQLCRRSETCRPVASQTAGQPTAQIQQSAAV